MQWTTNDLQRALKQVRKISVPLAEFEYVYDPQWQFDGEIDPNVLSAGGFPVMVLGRIAAILAAEKKATVPPQELVKRVDALISQAYVNLPEAVRLRLAQQLQQTVNQLPQDTDWLPMWAERVATVCREIENLRPDLSQPQVLNLLSNDVFGFCRVVPEAWAAHRQSLMAEFWQRADEGFSIGPFENRFLRQVQQFLRAFVRVSGLAQAGQTVFSEPVNIFKVTWEAELGYAAAWLLRQQNPQLQVQVQLDLLVNTGLVSLVPLKTIMIGFSKRQKRHVQRVVQADRAVDHFDALSGELSLENGERIRLFGVYPVAACVSSVMNADAFTWNYAPTAQLNWHNPCERWLFLANLLNAKAATTSIYHAMEEKLGCDHRQPPTEIISNLMANASVWGDGTIVIKEGGHCSAGGQEVRQVKLPKVQVAVLQRQVPSLLFQREGRALHGHVRCVAILDAQATVQHLGFVIKLSTKDNANSSAYLSYRLLFDSRGRFLDGSFVSGSEVKAFGSLAEAGLQWLLTPVERRRLFQASYRNWLISMLYLNEFLSQNPAAKVQAFVEHGIVEPSFWPKNGVVEQPASEEKYQRGKTAKRKEMYDTPYPTVSRDNRRVTALSQRFDRPRFSA